MKKIITMLLALSLVSATMFACGTEEETTAAETTAAETTVEEITEADTDAATDAPEVENTLTTYEEFVAATIDDEIVVETYIQAKQGWWEDNGVGVATFYTQNEEGGYFLYNMPCSKEEYDALVAGTKIKVTGYKAEWDGELELMNATYEVVEGDTYVAEPLDVTALLGTDELINNMNKLVSFTEMTVSDIAYKNDAPGDDIYVTFTKGDVELSACVEVYLTGVESEVYTTVGELAVGDVVDVEGFLYWYNGANPHITAIVDSEAAADDTAEVTNDTAEAAVDTAEAADESAEA